MPLMTVATPCELEDVLLRPDSPAAIGLRPEDVSVFLECYVARAEKVIVRQRVRPSIQDPTDKISALRARGMLHAMSPEEQETYLAARAAQSSQDGFAGILQQASTGGPALPGDEIPLGWLSPARL